MPSQRERRAATRTAVVEAAIAIFGESSVAATSLDDIASRADIAKSTILYHFESRSGVLQAVAIELITRFEQRLADRPDAAGLNGFVSAVLHEQCTPRGRVLYGINDELTDAGHLDAIDPMHYLTGRLADFGVGERAEPIAAAMVQYGRMLARAQRDPADVPAITTALLS